MRAVPVQQQQVHLWRGACPSLRSSGFNSGVAEWKPAPTFCTGFVGPCLKVMGHELSTFFVKADLRVCPCVASFTAVVTIAKGKWLWVSTALSQKTILSDGLAQLRSCF